LFLSRGFTLVREQLFQREIYGNILYSKL